MKKKIALITGICGQDGAYLAQFLLNKNYKVIGADRRSSRNTNWRLKELGILDEIEIEDFELGEITNIYNLINKYKFTEIYNLAAQSFVKTSFSTPINTCDVNALGVLRILECIRMNSKKTKFFQASTSEMIGNSKEKRQNENSEFNPQSPYGIAKLFAHNIVKNYREAYNLFACSAISFNHESPLRGEEFVTKKIVKNLVAIKKKKINFFELGNLEAKRDWGFAKDYVEAFWKMLQIKSPHDLVICTGKTVKIKDFVNLTLKKLNFKFLWVGKGINTKCINLENNQTIIKINKKYFRPTEVNYLCGNSKKAKNKIKWKAKTDLKKLVNIMCEFELKKFN